MFQISHPEHSIDHGTIAKGLEELAVGSDHATIQGLSQSQVKAIVDTAFSLDC